MVEIIDFTMKNLGIKNSAKTNDHIFMGEVMARLSEIRVGKDPSHALSQLKKYFNEEDITKLKDNIWGFGLPFGMMEAIEEE